MSPDSLIEWYFIYLNKAIELNQLSSNPEWCWGLSVVGIFEHRVNISGRSDQMQGFVCCPLLSSYKGRIGCSP
eukprot:9197047-Ditylum_brightwellii.AAC.1